MSEVTRRCRTCGESKLPSEFSVRRETGKLQGDCRKCKTARASAWKRANPEKARASQREANQRRRSDPARAESVSAERERSKLRRRMIPREIVVVCARCATEFAYTKVKAGQSRRLCDECQASPWAWQKFGLTGPALKALRDEHGDGCAICGATDPGDQWGRNLHIDHDHETGRIRGLLCGPCNRGIGLFADDPARLRAAADYLDRHQQDP